MNRLGLKHLLAALLPLWIFCAQAQLPVRDLVVELRELETTDGAGYSVGTTNRNAPLMAQRVQVRNGEKAGLSMVRTLPLQWLESVQVQTGALTASNASASSVGAGIRNALIWVSAGQSLQVQPRWPGGKQAVQLSIELQASAVEPRVGDELPQQSRSQLHTTVSTPLGQWTTLASTGKTQTSGVYDSEGASQPGHVLQIRVLAP